MKKILALFLVLLFAGAVFAAGEKGQGECTVDTEEVIGGKWYSEIKLIFTAKTTNISGGVVKITVPSGCFPQPILAAGSARLTAVSTGTIGTPTLSGYTYTIPCTTVNIDQTITVTFAAVTVTAGSSQAFTWAVVQSADSTTNTASIATLPVTYRWNANNAFAIAQAPTPNVLTTDVKGATITVTLSTTYTGGRIYIAKPAGTPGYQTTPNIPDFSTVTYNAGYFVASSAGAVLTPVSLTGSLAVLPVATMAAGAVITCYFGGGDGTAAKGFQGTNYVKNARAEIWGNALGTPAATVTPVATTFYFNAYVPTPTIALTATVNYKQQIVLGLTGYKGSTRQLSGGGNAGKLVSNSNYMSTLWNFSQPGTNTITYIDAFYDLLNDGELRTNTTTASVTTYNMSETGQILTNSGIAITQDDFHWRIDKGDAHFAMFTEDDLDSGEAFHGSIYVPAGKILGIETVLSSGGAAQLAFYKSVTFTSDAGITTLTVYRRDLGTASVTSKFYANTLTNTAGNLLERVSLGSSQGAVKLGGTSGYYWELPAGSYLWLLTGKTDNSLAEVKFNFYEE